MVDVTVVIPSYKGLHNIEPLLQRLVPVLDSTGLLWNILFIDDHSPDGTFNKLKQIHAVDSRIKAIKLAENRGQQNAVYCGLSRAKSELMITMDDDLQHPPEIIPDLIRRIAKGGDLIYAVSREKSRPLLLRWGTALNSLFFSLFLGKPQDVEIGSYRIFKRSLVERIKGEQRKFIYVSALVFRLKPKPEVQSFRFLSTESESQGNSRFSLKKRFYLFYLLFSHYGPIRFLIKRKGNPYHIGEEL